MRLVRELELLIEQRWLIFQDPNQSQGKVLQVNEFVLLISLDLVEQLSHVGLRYSKYNHTHLEVPRSFSLLQYSSQLLELQKAARQRKFFF